ncbi:MAG: DUF4445 domain-containing protein [Dehalococcoidales bacterium]|nr:DUF4445 domain-containing protein [Dehalococcoidales bacterium]
MEKTKSIRETFRVRFIPDNIEVNVSRGTNLLAAAEKAGLLVNASCGGMGVCQKCKVIIQKGEVNVQRSERLSSREYDQGVRLACQSEVISDLIVAIPSESRIERNSKPVETRKPINASPSGLKPRPPLQKYYLELVPPSLDDNASDLFRLLDYIKSHFKLPKLRLDLDVIRKLSATLREADWKVTVSTLVDSYMPLNKKAYWTRIINIEAGDTRAKNLALAVDLGTTTVCAQMLDLNQNRIVATATVFNKQKSYGDDVITRIAYCQKPEGLTRLQKKVVESINEAIDILIKESPVDRKDIGHIALAGNTTMQQILLGLDPKNIRLYPYIPTANFLPLVNAASLGLDVAEHVNLYTFPSISSYVGGDIVSGVVSVGIHRQKKITYYLDIGTNGEIVLGNSEWMVSTSCSAGPAFEGGGILCGMVAIPGAIQGFSIAGIAGEPEIKVIGDVKPAGICGSGLISIIADFLISGIIDRNGKFQTGRPVPRIREGMYGLEYVIARAEETQTGKDIVITEIDIENLIRAKAAMYAGCQTLSECVNVNASDFEQVIIAGNFGNSMNIEKAITIGLLPDIPRDRFIFIGNGSLAGARLVNFSSSVLNWSLEAAQMMTNIELSDNVNFNANYTAALFLPHTNDKIFPSVVNLLSHGENNENS